MEDRLVSPADVTTKKLKRPRGRPRKIYKSYKNIVAWLTEQKILNPRHTDTIVKRKEEDMGRKKKNFIELSIKNEYRQENEEPVFVQPVVVPSDIEEIKEPVIEQKLNYKTTDVKVVELIQGDFNIVDIKKDVGTGVKTYEFAATEEEIMKFIKGR